MVERGGGVKVETVFYCDGVHNVLAWISNGLDFVGNKMMAISMALIDHRDILGGKDHGVSYSTSLLID